MDAESKLSHADEKREFEAWRRKGMRLAGGLKPRADFVIREERTVVRKVSSGHVIRYRLVGRFRGLFV
ncbi:MAG: hypothetical protein AB7U76_24280 [Pirellulales bacterium]